MKKRYLFGAPLLIAATALGIASSQNASVANAVAGAIRDPMSLIAARSPGERGDGALYNIKPLKITVPTEPLVYPTVTPSRSVVMNDIDYIPAIYGPLNLLYGTPIDVVGGPFFADIPSIGGGGIPMAPPIFGGGGGGIIGGGGFIGGGDTPPPAAVPEPSTWAMTMLGIGLIGFVMRKKNKQVVDNA